MRRPIGGQRTGQVKNLSLNVSKTKALIVDSRNRWAKQAPINIDGAVVERVESFIFLGVHITKLSWSKHTKTVMKRAQQNLFPLRRQKIFGMGPQILKRFYSCTIESILNGCNCSAAHKNVRDSSHPSYRLFSLLLHDKRYRSAKSRTKRLLNSFDPKPLDC